MIKRLGQWSFVVLGLIVAAWGAWSWLSPDVTCRGVVMQPGDVCRYSSPTATETDRTQTYEERLAATRSGAPTMIAVGVLAMGFGAWVALRSPKAAQASSDIGP